MNCIMCKEKIETNFYTDFTFRVIHASRESNCIIYAINIYLKTLDFSFELRRSIFSIENKIVLVSNGEYYFNRLKNHSFNPNNYFILLKTESIEKSLEKIKSIYLLS